MNQDNPYRTLSIDSVHEAITCPIEEGGIPKFSSLTMEELRAEINNLVESGNLMDSLNENQDECVRIDSHGKTIEQIKKESLSLNPLAKAIYSFLLDSNNVLWTIALGAQKTKTAQMIRGIQELIKASTLSSIRTIPFLFSLNSLDLMEQTGIRFITSLENVQFFIFASRKMDTREDELLRGADIVYNPHLDHAKLAVNTYIQHGGKMPLFISLPNKIQVNKCVSILEYIVLKRNELRVDCGHSMYFDEADAIYPPIRDLLKKFIIDDTNNRPNPANHGTFWVSATIDTDITMNFEEVLKAYQYAVYIDPTVEVNYRNIDVQPDAKIPDKFLHQDIKESNNDFIIRIVMEHLGCFNEKVTGRNGVSYYRRIICLADRENDKQRGLADKLARTNGFSSIIYNQTGFPVYWKNSDGSVFTKTIKRKDFPKALRTKCINEKIKWIYDNNVQLQTAPLFIIGNKMIDRGLSFHFAPRGESGIAWLLTDIIMGHYAQADYRRAAQAVARLWGVIAHRPEYCGTITHWLDARTRELVLRDARKTKHIQDNSYVPQPFVHLSQQADDEVEEEALTCRRNVIQSEVYNCPENIDFTELINAAWANDNNGVLSNMRDRVTQLIPQILIDKWRQEIGIPDRRHPTSYKCCDNGYIVSTHLSTRDRVARDGLSSDHRIILERVNADCQLKLLSDVSLTDGFAAMNGTRICQNFAIIPLYPNEDSDPSELQWVFRYEVPLKDIGGSICFIDDEVMYNGQRAIIKDIYASKNGDRVKAKLTLQTTGEELNYINEFSQEDKKIPGDHFVKI
jgi:hypothetical protein